MNCRNFICFWQTLKQTFISKILSFVHTHQLRVSDRYAINGGLTNFRESQTLANSAVPTSSEREKYIEVEMHFILQAKSQAHFVVDPHMEKDLSVSEKGTLAQKSPYPSISHNASCLSAQQSANAKRIKIIVCK